MSELVVHEHVLKTVALQLKISASAADIERLRTLLQEKLNLSVRGLAIDCAEADLNDLALEMLFGLTKVAKDDGKRLTLIKLSDEAKRSIERNRSQRALDVFGEPIVERAKEKPKRTWKQFRKSAARILVPVLFALPPVVWLEYYIMHWEPSTKVTSSKSFESPAQERFVISGRVDVIQQGKRRPDRGAIVIAWINEADSNDQSLRPAWVTHADASGSFNLNLNGDQDVQYLPVRITVMSEVLDAPKPNDDPYAPAAIRPNAYHPTRHTQTYEYVIESGKPVRMNLLFF